MNKKRGACKPPPPAHVSARAALTRHAPARHAAQEFLRLGRDLVTLPPKTLNRLAVPSDLREAIDEARLSSCAAHRTRSCHARRHL
jgi:ribosomal 50S subunit-associated protein YjgA (DUF615 family)